MSTRSIEEVFRLVDGMRERGALSFTVGDISVVLGASQEVALLEPSKQLDLDGMDAEADHKRKIEDDLYWSAQ